MLRRAARSGPVRAAGVRIRTAVGGALLAALALGLALAGPPRAAAASRSERAQEALEKALRRLERGDLAHAVKLFEKADRLSGGTSAGALAGLARCHLRLGRADDAVAAAGRWLEAARGGEERAAASFTLGLAHYRRGLSTRWRALDTGAGSGGAGGGPGGASFQAAVAAFGAALDGPAAGEARRSARLGLARALTELGLWGEVREALSGAAFAGDDPVAVNLRCWAEHAGEPPRWVEAGAAGRPGATVERAVELYAPFPGYTREARQAKVRGTMRLRLIVTPQGDVRCLRVLRGLPHGLVDAAVPVVLGWRFRPALADGQPVVSYYDATLAYNPR